MKKLLVLLLLLASPAFAQSRIDQLGAGAAVGDTDKFPACQGCGSSTAAVSVTGSQLKTYLGAISCPTGFTSTLGRCIWTKTVTSSTATIDYTGLGSSYDVYNLYCHGMSPVSTGDRILLRVGTGGTPTWQAANYNTGSVQGDSAANAPTTTGAANATSAIILGNTNQTNSAVSPTSFEATFFDVANNSTTINVAVRKHIVAKWGQIDGSANAITGMTDGFYTGDTNAVTGIRILFNNSNIASGVCTLEVVPQ